MRNSDYDILARSLAMNYFNISIRPGKSEREKLPYSLETIKSIFGIADPEDKYLKEEASFTRNILIVGAGASKGQIDLKDGEGMIKIIEEKLKLHSLLEEDLTRPNQKSALNLKYRSLASQYNNRVYGPTIDLSKIQKELGFEGRLSLLLHFFEKGAVLDLIKDSLDIRRLPVHFYEIIAHLFKHRFIDVIINFNFDELLDNAIDDILPPKSYVKVIHDSDCVDINEISETRMLKFPIYIKPHGSISSKSSLLFTNEHYINVSADIKQMLKSIFMGEHDKKSQKNLIRNFNVIVAGFAMESIELNDILFTQLTRKPDKSNSRLYNTVIYLFNKNNQEVSDRFQSQYRSWFEKLNSEDSAFQGANIRLGLECSNQITLADHFENLYQKVVALFQRPFKPCALSLPTLSHSLFPPDQVKLIAEELLNDNRISYLDYLRKRSIFYLLFELIRGKGEISLESIDSRQSGRYFRELNKATIRESIRDGGHSPSLDSVFDSLKKFLKGGDSSDILLVKETDGVISLSAKIESLPPDEQFVIHALAEKMIQTSIIPQKNLSERSQAHAVLLKEIKSLISMGSYDICPDFEDEKHLRFSPFPSSQFLTTNLALTYWFFHFATVCADEWDEFWFSGDSGKALVNLHDYSSKAPSYLEKMRADGKRLKVILNKQNLTPFSLWAAGHNSSHHKRNEDLIKEKLGDQVEIRHLSARQNVHYIGLFLKKEKPRFGMYFYRHEGSTKVNPIFFDGRKTHKDISGGFHPNNQRNLWLLHRIFLEQFNSSELYHRDWD